MIFTETKIPGVLVVELEKREDPRGYFARAWCAQEFENHGLPQFVQTNMSMSRQRGTVIRRSQRCAGATGSASSRSRSSRRAKYAASAKTTSRRTASTVAPDLPSTVAC